MPTFTIPAPRVPEYRLVLVWHADEDGPGTRVYLTHEVPGQSAELLQCSVHQTLNLLEAAEAALTTFFEPEAES